MELVKWENNDDNFSDVKLTFMLDSGLIASRRSVNNVIIIWKYEEGLQYIPNEMYDKLEQEAKKCLLEYIKKHYNNNHHHSLNKLLNAL